MDGWLPAGWTAHLRSPDEQRRLLRRCVEEARCGGADVAVAVPAPDQRAAHLSLGFIPMPLTMRVIGKPLSPGTEVGTDWHFSLGDTDFL